MCIRDRPCVVEPLSNAAVEPISGVKADFGIGFEVEWLFGAVTSVLEPVCEVVKPAVVV